MRISKFILANIEPILVDWENFAREIWPGGAVPPSILRNHAEEMLRAIARDIEAAQTDLEQSEKSRGEGEGGNSSARVDKASEIHAVARAVSGFDLRQLAAEYRALRASVLRLWSHSHAEGGSSQLDDMTRFNESVDQLLASALESYSQHVEQSRDIFLGILGHDLRSPLQAVAWHCELLENHGPPEPGYFEMASKITTTVKEMGKLVGDLLDYAGGRLGAQMQVVSADMNLKSLCQDVLGEFSVVHPGHAFEFESRGDLRGFWDASRLRQLLSNLIGNAVQHGTPGGLVTVLLEGEAEQVVVSVRNQGTPIPPDTIGRIFEPMKCASSSPLARRAGSIGLGLYIAREIAIAHGGSIDLKSDKSETLFSVRLPRG